MTPIRRVRLGHLDYSAGRPPLEWAGRLFQRSALVAVLETEDGPSGIGIAWCRIPAAVAYATALGSVARPILEGRDGRDPQALAARLALALRRGGMTTAAVLDLAIWDLAGQLARIPSADLLGRRHRDLPVYAIDAAEFGFQAAEHYVELAEGLVSAGFRALKFHLTGRGREDVAICHAIRAAVGDDVVLMLDPAGRYARAEALHVRDALSELGFDRLEDPLPPEDWGGYVLLSTGGKIAISVNDALTWSPFQCAEALQRGVVQILRCDPGRAGLTATSDAAALAATYGGELDVSAFAPQGGAEAALAAALASPSSRWFEWHLGSGLIEIPGVTPGMSVTGGKLDVAERPGLGFEVDRRELDRYCRWVQ